MAAKPVDRRKSYHFESDLAPLTGSLALPSPAATSAPVYHSVSLRPSGRPVSRTGFESRRYDLRQPENPAGHVKVIADFQGQDFGPLHSH